jgi:hypothetical protein
MKKWRAERREPEHRLSMASTGIGWHCKMLLSGGQSIRIAIGIAMPVVVSGCLELNAFAELLFIRSH